MNPDLLFRLLAPDSGRPSSADNDRALILPIIILLLSEKCDFFLIFSLLYILM